MSNKNINPKTLILLVLLTGFIGPIIYKLIANKTHALKRYLIGLLVFIVIVAIIVLAIVLGDNGDREWDDLSDEEKEWYHNNYGSGQYDKYKDAINDYKNKN